MASLVAQLVKNLPAMCETWVWSLGWEDPLEKGKATHSSILAWRIPWTVYSMGSQRVIHDWMTFTSGWVVKNTLANAADTGLIPGSGKSPGEGNGSPLQYSCLGNTMERGAWWAIVHGVTKELTQWLTNNKKMVGKKQKERKPKIISTSFQTHNHSYSFFLRFSPLSLIIFVLISNLCSWNMPAYTLKISLIIPSSS